MAFAAVERLIAFRYLRARREEGFISVIAGFSLVGIALGVGTLIVVMAVMNGFRIEMLHQMSGMSGQLGVQGNAQGNQNGLEATPDLLARLRAVPGVTSATPAAEGQVMAVTGEQARGVLEGVPDGGGGAQENRLRAVELLRRRRQNRLGHPQGLRRGLLGGGRATAG